MTISLPFKTDLADKVEDGSKSRTIRRSKPDLKPGDIMRGFAWTGGPYRSKHRELGYYEIIELNDVGIYESSIYLSTCGRSASAHLFHADDLHQFARLDGVESFALLKQHFIDSYGPLPFVGTLIQWKFPRIK